MNHLEKEKSPYLLQHASNPVDWYPWGEAAFEKAKREDRPVFLSIGYSTCHWCHVMAHESFEDQETAEYLNGRFVCIKVDREERPDIDSVYMAACQAVTGSGGWPLTAVLTPDQKPFFLGTYFPKHRHGGQPGLLELLQKIDLLWRQDRGRLLETGQHILEAISAPAQASEGVSEKHLLNSAVKIYRQQFDPRWGGFGQAPKFPAPHNILFLLQYGSLEQDEEVLFMAEKTLASMARGGIHDQIGGGFSRYATDEKWLVPHFEKMLYDNALLASAYLEAFRITGKKQYADTARRTLDYVLKELTGPEGEFYCGQDADSDGTEGKYYLFTPEEIRKVLGRRDGEEFCRTYDITPEGNFEGMSVPNRIGRSVLPWPAEDERLAEVYAYRRKRTRLHRDDKVILSWNSWMITAFSKASQILGERRYQDAALTAERFIKNHMTGTGRRLYLRWRDGEAAVTGQLDDYAVYGLALLELYRTTYEVRYLQDAVYFAGQMLDLFEDRNEGGFFLTASDAEALITRPKETYDGAVPSGNSAAAELLGQLAQYTCSPVWREAFRRQTGFLVRAAVPYPHGYSYGLQALLKTLYPPRELVCVSAGSELPEPLRAYLRKASAVQLSVIFKTKKNQAELEAAIPYLKEYPIPDEGVMYYLCRNGSCMLPVQDFDKLGI